MTPAAASYFEPRLNVTAHTVLPGDHLVLDGPDAVTTLLGSCVAACVRDRRLGVGGLNHFLLPDGDGNASGSARYGVHAMELLLNGILRRGGRKSDFEAKVFGGARVIETKATDTIGDRNGRFVINYLKQEGIPVAAADLGGSRARRVFYFPSSGRARVVLTTPAGSNGLRDQEISYARTVKKAPAAGGVELF